MRRARETHAWTDAAMTTSTAASRTQQRRSARSVILGLPATALVGLLRLYQIVLSPMTGPTCRFYPSCSSYAITAVRRHGVLRGGGLAIWRVLRCNPWNYGGVDDVPPVSGSRRERHQHAH